MPCCRYVQHVGVQLADHVQPALQAACFTLGELMGLARCTRWLQPLGLQVGNHPDCACVDVGMWLQLLDPQLGEGLPACRWHWGTLYLRAFAVPACMPVFVGPVKHACTRSKCRGRALQQ